MAILSIMVAGILQLFSLALLASAGAAARTELLFKCQQVVENVRFCYALTRRSPALPIPAGSGVPPVFVDGTTVDLPYLSSDAGYAYWGPGGANVIEEDKGAFKISYTITHSSGSVNALWIITVSAIPTDDPVAARRFFGIGLRSFKRVDYAAAF
jgi:hypothetical protein